MSLHKGQNNYKYTGNQSISNIHAGLENIYLVLCHIYINPLQELFPLERYKIHNGHLSAIKCNFPHYSQIIYPLNANCSWYIVNKSHTSHYRNKYPKRWLKRSAFTKLNHLTYINHTLSNANYWLGKTCWNITERSEADFTFHKNFKLSNS